MSPRTGGEAEVWRARGRRERASLMGTPQSHSAALAFLEASSGRLGGGVGREKSCCEPA